MAKYVILKKIDNVWYATKNRYTAKELEVIVDKHYDDVVDFESINDGDCQGLDDGVIVVKDDGRELDKNGKYLNDDLKLETNTELEKGLNYLVGMPIFFMGVFTNIMSIDTAILLMFIWVALVKFVIVPNINNNKENPKSYKELQESAKEMQKQLPENHKARGMM